VLRGLPPPLPGRPAAVLGTGRRQRESSLLLADGRWLTFRAEAALLTSIRVTLPPEPLPRSALMSAILRTARRVQA
jgi:hypothetical protein